MKKILPHDINNEIKFKEGNLSIFDIKEDRRLYFVERSTRNSYALKRNELKTKAMLYHGLTYRNGHVTFQNDLRTNGYYFTPQRLTSEGRNNPKCWSFLMLEKIIYLGLADGVIEKYEIIENHLERTKYLSTGKSGVTNLLGNQAAVNPIVAVTLQAEIFLLNRENLEITDSFTQDHQNHIITTIRLLGSQLVTGSTDKAIRVISITKVKLVHVLRGHQHPITALTVCRDGKSESDSKGPYFKIYYQAF